MKTLKELEQDGIIRTVGDKVVLVVENNTDLVLYIEKNLGTYVELDRVPLYGVTTLDDMDEKINFLLAEYNIRDEEEYP
jgi:DNA-binding transcriptional regulator YhcF (GntR family)